MAYFCRLVRKSVILVIYIYICAEFERSSMSFWLIRVIRVFETKMRDWFNI